MKRIIRYLFSGGTSAVVNLGLLYIFTDILGVYYVVSGIISFCVAVFVSFYMQKKWTFQDHSTENTHKKFIIYLTVAIINLGINTLLLYLLTDFAHLYYMVSQFITSGIVAFWSFFIYRMMFRDKKEPAVI